MAKAQKETALSPEERLQNALVPNWDYPYKVPKNWCWTYMGVPVKWGSGGTPSRSNAEYFKGDIPWVKTGELDDGIIVQTEEHISPAALNNSSAKMFPVNTVAIAMYGATIGKTGILGVPATTNQACACGICSDAVYYKYLFYYARSEKDTFIKLGRGGAQPNISQELIKGHELPLAPYEEQKRIVNQIEEILAKLDEAKEQAQAVVDSFETRKAAIFHKAFAGELTEGWREKNYLSISDWEKCTISDVCRVNPPKIKTTGLPDDMEVSFFPMPSLSEIYGEITEPQTRTLKEVKSGFTNFSEGDVVFAKITPCMENGKSAIIGKLVNDIGYGTTEFYVLRCGEMLLNKYLHHLVRSQIFRDRGKAVMTGAVGQQRVPRSFIESYPLHLPSLPEQREIVRILDDLFSKEQQTYETALAVIDSIDTMKKAVLAKAFRGELGTNDPADEPAIELLKRVLDIPAEPKAPVKRTRIPSDLAERIKTDMERKIVKLYIQNDTDTMTMSQLMTVSSKKFDIMNALGDLQRRGVLSKQGSQFILME